MEYPELAARTRRFTCGAPRAVTVANDGSRVAFLRSAGPEDPSDALWVLDVDSGTERLVVDPRKVLDGDAPRPADDRQPHAQDGGIASYASDPALTVAVFTLDGRLFRADLRNGDVVEVPSTGPALDPRPDPSGSRIAYVTAGDADTRRGELRVIQPDGSELFLAGEDGGITWGLAEFVATHEFGRRRGYWWAPDGLSILAARVNTSRVPRWHLHDPSAPESPPISVGYPRAGAPHAEVTLHFLDLDEGWVDVHWDRETYPYVVAVDWSERTPLITVLRRSQQHGLVLAIDPRTGETQVHAELADTRWVEVVPGTPTHLADGRVLIGGELAHDGYDARCLFADGTLLTPPSLYVRRVVGQLPNGDLLVEASDGEPGEQHLFRIGTALGAAQSQRLTSARGWHVGALGGDVLVVGEQSLDHPGVRWTVRRGDQELATLRSWASAPPFAPRPALTRVTDRQLPSAVLYPRDHVAGRRLPVLVDVNGGPGRQEVRAARAAWLERQWWADAGFAVVTVDNRGTPGIAPSFEKAIHRRVADVVLADQVDALFALSEKHPDLDLDRVAIRGWSFGGWLAGLAVLRRPDVFRCGVVGTPVTDWTLYDAVFAERYLGVPSDGDEIYQHHSLVALAAEPPHSPAEARPLLLVHGLRDPVVVTAHTLRLSAALLSAGRPHAVLPLAGACDGVPDGQAQHLLHMELDFVRRNVS
ncbi:MAG: peptidase S9 [Actinobacteria bacterium]|nr:MAG: peptidase S9 [Actinomycetota bacterium]